MDSSDGRGGFGPVDVRPFECGSWRPGLPGARDRLGSAATAWPADHDHAAGRLDHRRVLRPQLRSRAVTGPSSTRTWSPAGYDAHFVGSQTDQPRPHPPRRRRLATRGTSAGSSPATGASTAPSACRAHIDHWLAPGNGVNPNLILLDARDQRGRRQLPHGRAPYELAALITRISRVAAERRDPGLDHLPLAAPRPGTPRSRPSTPPWAAPAGSSPSSRSSARRWSWSTRAARCRRPNLSPDGVHPTAAGYAELGTAWFHADPVGRGVQRRSGAPVHGTRALDRRRDSGIGLARPPRRRPSARANRRVRKRRARSIGPRRADDERTERSVSGGPGHDLASPGSPRAVVSWPVLGCAGRPPGRGLRDHDHAAGRLDHRGVSPTRAVVPGGYRSILYQDLIAAGYDVQFVGSQTDQSRPDAPRRRQLPTRGTSATSSPATGRIPASTSLDSLHRPVARPRQRGEPVADPPGAGDQRDRRQLPRRRRPPTSWPR